MTREQFLNNLYHRLGGLTQEQAEQHLTYYAEMLADRMEEGMTEEEAVASMEDVDTIARRILEEEGLPPGSPVTPPAYPDVSKIPGGGGTKGYQAPKKWNYRKAASILLWVVAAVCVLGALKRFTGRLGGGAEVLQGVAPDSAFSGVEAVEEIAPMDNVSMPEELDFYQEWPLQAKYYFPADEVEEIRINWTSGVVDIQGGGSDVTLLERSDSGGHGLSYTLEDGVLAITGSTGGLTVSVPDGLVEQLEISTASADVRVQDAEVDTLSVKPSSGSVALWNLYVNSVLAKTVSGDILVSGLYADDLEFSTTSGDITGDVFSGEDISLSTISGDVVLDADFVEEITGHSTSGCFQISLLGAEEVNLQSRSGDIRLMLPEDLGFQLFFDTVSGSIEAMYFPGTHANGVFTCGDGSCEVDISTTSGDLYMMPQ